MDGAGKQELVYAGFLRRAAAVLVDIAVLCAVGAAMQAAYYNMQFQNTVYPLVLAAYYIGLEGGKWRASFGKRLLKIEVGALDGGKAPLPKIVARYLVYVVPALPFTWLSMTGNYAVFLETYFHIDEMMGPGAHKLFLQTPESHRLLFPLAHAVIFYFAARIFLYVMPIALTDQKTGLHDWISKTRVYNRPAPEAAQAEASPTAE
jgi:uncharacterized RDD family membrane protein YckC